MERNVDSASDFVLAYNAAPVQVQVDVQTALQQIDARIARIETSFATPAGQAAPVAPPPEPPRTPGGVPGTRSGPVAERTDGDIASVDVLRRQAATLLRWSRTEEFRAVEAELERLGSSARPHALLQTSLGAITIQLLPDFAPKAVRNFIELADGTRPWHDPRQRERLRRGAKLYDGTVFHRVIRGLMIQGGDPLGTGHGGPGYLQAHELHRDLSFDRPYMVAMANSGPNSDGSQFFITVGPAPWLTYKHTIFGRVVDGMTVADRISEVPVDPSDRPIEDVVLMTVRIIAAAEDSI